MRRVPPLHDRRDLVESLLAAEGSTHRVRRRRIARRVARATLAGRGHDVALLHSDEPAAARTDAWRRATAGGIVVVGGRVAALAPVPDLAAAIVVDDADESLQEERVPTWHARDVLLERAHRAGARWTVVSAAPTAEAEAVVDFAPDAPPSDVEISGWPRVVVVDRREQPPGARLLTEPLADALRTANGLAVCLLNRRGRFRLLACDACHELLRWDRNAERPLICPSCGEARLRVVRAGVSRVREELAALVPAKTVSDVDTDSDDAPVAADIVVGTEAVLHRPDIRRRRPTLVAFLDLDQELLAPRYRAVGASALAVGPRRAAARRAPPHRDAHVVADPRPRTRGRACGRRGTAGDRHRRRDRAPARVGLPAVRRARRAQR